MVREELNKGFFVRIAPENVVSIHFTLKNDEGTTLESSKGGQPLAYIQGVGQMIPSLESALEGKQKGDKIKVSLAPEQAYGERNEEIVQVVPRAEFAAIEDLEVGTEIEADGGAGPVVFTVTEIRDDEVVIDGNHPFAGMTLHFDVEVMDVREATDEELDHGHVHGPGGHHHH